MVRSSMYLQTLPPLDLECLELDGDFTSLPVIFEDIYDDQPASSGLFHVYLTSVMMLIWDFSCFGPFTDKGDK